MYYTNISNEELQQFHGFKVNNFVISLTDILNSRLFTTEIIKENKLYKILPLFYTGRIVSSNTNDKIMDNRIILCSKNDKETYFTFISDDGTVVDYSDYADYFKVGDSLTINQFNGLVSLLRHFIIHSEDIRVADNVVGVYGTYEFNFAGATILDSGIVVSDETISSKPKVRLNNPTFNNSSYVLNLSVLHYTDVNVFDENDEDFIVVETLEIPLTSDWVEIPVDDLEEDYIISFNATVTINHNKDIVRNIVVRLFDLVSDKDIVQKDEVYNLSVKAWDSVAGVSGQTVEFLQFNPLLFYFEGRGGFEVDDFQYNHSAITVSSDDNGTLVSNPNSGATRIYWANVTGTSTSDREYDYFNGTITDFDLVEVTGRVDFLLRNSNNNTLIYNKTLSSTGHLTFEIVDGYMKYYLDGALVDSVNIDTSYYYQISFYVYNNASFKFKNFIIGGY